MGLLNSLSRNRLVSDVYEPGSTFKIITSAINLEEYYRGNTRAFSPNYVFSSSRTRAVDGTTVKCWSNHANGKHCNQTLSDALNNSCNPCFTDMALSLGKETFYQYLSAFGFGKKTGLDFNGEAYGLLMPKQAVRNCDLARIGFGQTVAVSGLQLACATAAAVNGGYYYTPSLVKRIYADDGYIHEERDKGEVKRTIGEKASKTLAEMLEGVVRDGSGKKAYIEGYRIGGKTGTAQKYENGRIAVGKYVSSFVGFFPVDNPKYLTLVIVDEPKGAYYGSVVAAPVAGEVFQGIISLKNIQANIK
jgi:stage V sporulation protein D (sporulation-specific penicillin-binding protein)